MCLFFIYKHVIHREVENTTNAWTAPSCRAKVPPKTGKCLPEVAQVVSVAMFMHGPVHVDWLTKTEWTSEHPKNQTYLKVTSWSVTVT
jgi:hypothetical protein